MNINFSGNVFYWRGPAPWYFVAISDEGSDQIRAIADIVTYGWGVIPVVAVIGGTTWETSIIPKDGRYLVPIKATIRKAESISEGDIVEVCVQIDV